MNSIRTFAYAAVLSLTIFAAQPTPAAAEEVHGRFTLSHDVHLQKIVLHPGDYTFSVKTMGASEFLMLRGTNGGTDAMLVVNDVDATAPKGGSRLVLVSRDGQSFASTMSLADYDMTLRFSVPSDAKLK
jgi:hypothetical protein